MLTAAMRTADEQSSRPDLFAAIGRFLSEQRLSPDPVHYAFAHRLLSDPASPLAKTVAALTDGGIRLASADVQTLIGATDPRGTHKSETDAAADRAEHQLRDFAGLIVRMRDETSDFGRDLAAKAEDMADADATEIVRLTSAMLDRVRTAETRLEQANCEAETLREQLVVARGDARSDALTGLPNRRALLEDFATHTQSGIPLCLAVCDIDHFKRINDRFGHPVGDRVLRAIGGALSETCGGAFVTRYGGEEFAILFTGRTIEDAVATLDRARSVVAAKRYKMRADDTPLGAVTFSTGVVAVEPGEQFETAFDRADTLLYAAKNDGRNQIRY